MRLRYLHLKELPPLTDIAIPFAQEKILKRKLAIRFVVGVNGTGKTRLLQALTEVFIALAQGRKPLPFPVTLAYDLGQEQARTILLHYPGGAHSNAFLIEFSEVLPDNTDWVSLEEFPWQSESELPFPIQNLFGKRNSDKENFGKESLPSATSIIPFLPSPILVYTSGHTASWEALFAQSPNGTDLDPSRLNPQEELTEERPAGWSPKQEQDYQRRTRNTIPPRNHDEAIESFAVSQNVILLTTFQIKLAACAVTIHQAICSWRPNTTPPDERLTELLKEVGWKEPAAIQLKLSFPVDLISNDASQLHDLFSIASTVVSNPELEETRRLSFDLQSSLSDNLELKTIKSGEPRLVVQALFEILGGENPSPFAVFRTLHRWHQAGILQDVEIALQHQSVEGLLLYDWLSDGERMFVGRISLFYLLQNQQDALVILDEPETHFNDAWKRQLVDIIDDAMRDLSNEIVISTHSSIALTDVFAEEIHLLKKENGETTLAKITTPTFGADPSGIMINVFDAPDSIGKRALEYLDKMLIKEWKVEEVDELESLIRRVGPGYHRSELRTIWRRLNAASD